MDLQTTSTELKVLSEPTRVRLLALLRAEELTVAEMAEITRLAQPRVSTHLSKLKEADLVKDRRAGVSSFYRFNLSGLTQHSQTICKAILDGTKDPLLDEDSERLSHVLTQRASDLKWADKVAGDMERHYSPGRTWEATARTFAHLLNLGNVLDIASGDGAIAELLAPRTKTLTCADISPTVVKACAKRLAHFSHVSVQEADMHALPFEDNSFDHVILSHGLTYSSKPALFFSEAARVLRPSGQLLVISLNKHNNIKEVSQYDHANSGFTPDELNKLATSNNLTPISCQITSREKRQPHFAVVTLLASLNHDA